MKKTRLPGSPLARAIQKNSNLPCKAKGCPKPRYYLSGYCPVHARRMDWYGHWNGRHVKKEEYAKERRDVAALFEKNREQHEGLKNAEAWLANWLDLASQERPVPNERASKLVSRLHWTKLTPLDILTEVSAAWVFAWNRPKEFDDGQQLTYLLARTMVGMAPRETHDYWRSDRQRMVKAYKAIRGPVVGEVGEYLRSHLGLFFLNVQRYFEQLAQQEEGFRYSLVKPFEDSESTPQQHQNTTTKEKENENG